MKQATKEATDELAVDAFRSELRGLQLLTDRAFGYLLLGQWAFAVLCAVGISPLSWRGEWSDAHVQVWAAVGLGALLVSLPWALILTAGGSLCTRLVVSSSQALFSGLLVHVMGGRIEAHFHIFGALALLSFYRDASVFLPFVLIVFLDHLLRGLLWPESAFGVASPSALRAFEHAGWVLFETIFLLWGVAQSRQHVWKMSLLQASLKRERDGLEERVGERTAELHQAELYSENVLDSLDARICTLDLQGRITSTNLAWRQAKGLDPAEPLAQQVGADYTAACRACAAPARLVLDELADAVRRVSQGEEPRRVVEFPLEQAGKTRWIQARVSPFVGAHGAAAVVTHVDVTERVAATEKSLEESGRAAAFSKILRESPNEIYIFRQDDRRFIEVNEGVIERTGYDRRELMAMTPVELMAGIDVREFSKRLQPIVSGGQSFVSFQAELRTKAGDRYPVQTDVHKSVFHDLPVFVAIVTDLTRLRSLEHQLAQAQKLESMGQLAAGIAHEINTPMQCVASNTEFLAGGFRKLQPVFEGFVKAVAAEPPAWAAEQDRLKRLLSESRAEFLLSQSSVAVQETADASQRVVEIVRAMKAMSHPGSREKSLTDINELVRQAVTISRNQWKCAAELKLELASPSPQVPALAAELSQVLLNLIINAADAIIERFGERQRLGEIVIRTVLLEEHLRIEVSDNGAGMTESVREKIFTPFFTTKDVGKGTGQGLAIAYDVVVGKHGGGIDAASRQGEGTTIVVRLPCEEQNCDEAKSVPAAHALSGDPYGI